VRYVIRMGEVKIRAKFPSVILKGRDHSEDLCVGRRIILEWNLGKWGGAMDWMHLAQDRTNGRFL